MKFQIINFIKEAKKEFKKIKWPTKKEALRYTTIVIIITLVVASYLGTLDIIFSRILNLLIK